MPCLSVLDDCFINNLLKCVCGRKLMKNYISKIYSLPWGCSRIHILNFLMKHSYIKKWSLSKTKTFCRNTLISINVSWVKVLQVQRQRTQPSNCNVAGDTYLRYGRLLIRCIHCFSYQFYRVVSYSKMCIAFTESMLIVWEMLALACISWRLPAFEFCVNKLLVWQHAQYAFCRIE